MDGPGTALPKPRLRLNRGQQALAAAVVLLLVGLLVSTLQASAAQREHTRLRSHTESAGNNDFYTVRETRNYVENTERYLLGGATRRDIQVARALLGRRLQVVGTDGVAAGDATPPEYHSALAAMDDAVQQIPSGFVPAADHHRWTDFLLPKARTLSDSVRTLEVATLDDILASKHLSEHDLLGDLRLQLGLLIAALVAATVLFSWLAANVARQYNSARRALEGERQALQEAQERLDRLSALERGEAEVLEQIATAEPVPTIFDRVAQLAFAVAGERPVRIAAEPGSVVYPPGADVTRPPSWEGPFIDSGEVLGTIEVFGGPAAPDDLALTALTRCRELAHLALEREASAQQLSHQASHDALTGLANRTRLLECLADSLVTSRRRGTQLALLFCDLDRFKMVNDSIGHAGGDELLVEAARRLMEMVGETATVARLGGDEFVILDPDLPDRARAVALAERVRTALSAPYTIDGKEAFVGVSIGITFADESTVSGAELMREADVAMYRAKLTEGSRINVFDSLLEAEVAQRLDLDTALRRALERDQLQLAVQPIVTLTTGRITGFEALLRWNRPGLPQVQPDVFIPLAEDNGMIVEIGHWVLKEAIQRLAGWQAAGLAHGLTMSVNVSARQVREPGFADEILELLRVHGVPPESLVVELTEHALIDLLVAYPILGRLREAGVYVSLDDFGTGYSSLTQLRTLPVDEIKLDRSFAAALGEGDAKHSAVVQSVVALAEALALRLVIEGIETVAERDALIAMGACTGQGFLFARPMDWDAAQRLLETDGICAVAGGDYSTSALSAAPSLLPSTKRTSHRPSPSVST